MKSKNDHKANHEKNLQRVKTFILVATPLFVMSCASENIKKDQEHDIQAFMAQGSLFAKKQQAQEEVTAAAEAAPKVAKEKAPEQAQVSKEASLKDQLSQVASIKEQENGLRVQLQESFDFGSDALKPEAADRIEKIGKILAQHPEERIQIEGYTDNIGTEHFNDQLSKNRAKAVQDLLVKQGVRAGQLGTEGKGESNPVASNTTDQGRAQNRRAELVVVMTEPTA